MIEAEPSRRPDGRSPACSRTSWSPRTTPRSTRPTKPIGPFYSPSRLGRSSGSAAGHLSSKKARGWRRGGSSPAPLEVVELGQIRSLLDSGAMPVACGGGGIPVVRRDGTRRRRRDRQDRASALLAAALGPSGLSSSPTSARSGEASDAREEELRELSADEAEALLAELAEGSMRPKVEAAIAVARAGGEAIITALDRVEDALAGRAGTRIHRLPTARSIYVPQLSRVSLIVRWPNCTHYKPPLYSTRQSTSHGR